jgi:hypothetical protein
VYHVVAHFVEIGVPGFVFGCALEGLRAAPRDVVSDQVSQTGVKFLFYLFLRMSLLL